MKPVKKIFSGAMTFASAIVLILALCTVDMELSLLPIVIYFTALAWIVYSINKVCKGGEKDVQN
jgi:hypothetical protein